MRCPACKSPLVVIEREEIELDWCVSCHGLWFDEGELELLGEKAGRRIDVEDLGRRATVGKGARRCPRCPRRMETLDIALPAGGSIVIDRCALHGFWLDPGELGTLLGQLGTQRDTDEEVVLDFLGETFHGSAATLPTNESAPPGGRDR